MSETNEPISSGKTTLFRLILFLLLGLIVFLASSSVIVSENQNAIVLRFGRPSRTITDAGWYFRWPVPIEKIQIIDTRLQHGSIRISETLTVDKRNVIVPMYFSWKVSDPLKFLNNIEDPGNANTKLDSLITSARNSVLGSHEFNELLSIRDGRPALALMEEEMLAIAGPDAREHFGIELVGVGMTQIKLPEGNTESVFRRMRAERMREASAYRGEGQAEAEKIKAEANKKGTQLIAEAKRKAEEVRGQAEADSARIYAEAHGQNPEFYRFLRSLQSLRTVVDRNTTLVLDTSRPPFHLLELEDPREAPHLQSKPSERDESSSSPLTLQVPALDPAKR